MFDSVYVEVAAAMAVIFFLVASVLAAMNQWVSRLLSIRAKVLWRALANVLDSNKGQELDLTLPVLFRQAISSTAPTVGSGGGATLSGAMANAPTVRSLAGPPKRDSRTRVDHIPSKIFARTLVSIAAEAKDPTLAKLKSRTAGTALGGVVGTISDSTQNWMDEASELIEQWYDGYMDRLSELYRVAARKILFIAGFALAIVLNVNAVGLIGELSTSTNTRAALTGAIDLCADGDTTESCANTIITKLDESDAAVGLPIVGDYQAPWNEFDDADGLGGWVQVVLGWLATGLAVSFGAPFWFDVARRLSNLRRS